MKGRESLINQNQLKKKKKKKLTQIQFFFLIKDKCNRLISFTCDLELDKLLSR